MRIVFDRMFVLFPIALMCVAGCSSHESQVARQSSNAELESASAKPSRELGNSHVEQAHPLSAFEERNDDPLAAAADRYERRLSADGTVPRRALLKANDQRKTLALARGTGGNLLPVDWDWVGPGNIGGRIRPIVIDPSNPSIMYVGSASGGIWKTTNGGQLWTPLDDFLPSLAIADLVIHPNDSSVLFAATGEGFFDTVEGTSNTAAVRGAGIFRSVDAGVTWNQIPATDHPDFYFVNRLEFDPTDSNIMLAAANSGIWRSTDGGNTWNLQLAFHALDVKYNPSNPLQVVAGGHHQHDGPFYSSDGGITWAQSTGAEGHRQEMAWAPSEPSRVYAAVSNSNEIKIWQSDDGGQTYILNTTGNGISTWSGYNTTIWIDPADPDFMILGGVYLYRSTNAGGTFSRRFNAVHADMHRIVAHPDFDGTNNRTLFFATDGGLWQTDNVYGSSAFSLNNNLGITQFYGGALNPTNGNIVGGTQDNGTLFYAGDPQDWDHIFGGDGGYAAADPTAPYYFYGEVQRALIHRSTNGSNSGYIYNGPNPIADAGGSGTNFIPFFMLDPNDPHRMLVACRRMWRSNNVRDSQPDWFPIKDSIEPPGRGKDSGSAHFAENSPYNLSTIAVADGNPDIIWAAHNNGNVYVSNDGTAQNPSWVRVDENGVGLPDRWVSTVVIDPRDHLHVYVALMGWHSDNIYETTDGGQTWNNIASGGNSPIPDAPISALAMHPNVPGELMAGTDVGVFLSIDNGENWSPVDEGPGNVPVEQIKWADPHRFLVVTHGRGMFVANESTTAASGFELLEGIQNSGDLNSLSASDGNTLQLRHRRALLEVVEFAVTANVEELDPVMFALRIQSEQTGGLPGDVSRKTFCWDFDAGQYELVDESDANRAGTATVIRVAGDVSRFIDPANGEVRAKIRWVRDPFIRRPFFWSVEIDETVWLVR